MNPPQQLEVTEHDDVVIATVTQTRVVDAASVVVLKRELEAMVATTSPKNVVVALGRVEYVSSAGLGALIKLHRALSAEKRLMSVHCPSDTVFELIHMTRLDGLLEVRRTLEDALRVVGKKRFGIF